MERMHTRPSSAQLREQIRLEKNKKRRLEWYLGEILQERKVLMHDYEAIAQETLQNSQLLSSEPPLLSSTDPAVPNAHNFVEPKLTLAQLESLQDTFFLEEEPHEDISPHHFTKKQKTTSHYENTSSSQVALGINQQGRDCTCCCNCDSALNMRDQVPPIDNLVAQGLCFGEELEGHWGALAGTEELISFLGEDLYLLSEPNCLAPAQASELSSGFTTLPNNVTWNNNVPAANSHSWAGAVREYLVRDLHHHQDERVEEEDPINFWPAYYWQHLQTAEVLWASCVVFIYMLIVLLYVCKHL